MSTTTVPKMSEMIRAAQQACVGYYHVCTDHDDWGTLDTHWIQVESEVPAPGYVNRYFVRVKDAGRLVHSRNSHSLVHSERGTMCVTFLDYKITDVGWYLKPRGRHAHPLESYYHRDDEKRIVEIASKPEGYGTWA